MKINFQDCKKIREFAGRLGIKHDYLHPVFERDDGSRDVCDLRLSKEEIYTFFLENSDEIPYAERTINQPICNAGINQCSLSPFGDVYPCFHTVLPIKLGNLTEQSLEEIWIKSDDLEDFRNLKISHLKGCSECPAASYCSICPGLNMRANNNMLEPARVCCDYAFIAREVFASNKKFKKGGGDNR